LDSGLFWDFATTSLVCRRTHPAGESAEQLEVMMNKADQPQIEPEPPDLG